MAELFIKQFLSNPIKTGTIAASSKKFAEKICDTAKIEKCDCIVEFGSGTGVFTEEIHRRLKPGAVFFAIEILPDFVEQTRRRCPDVTVYQDSAENVSLYLEKHGRKTCDTIISALPWTIFEDNLRERLLNEVDKVLEPGGQFLTIALTHGKHFPGARKFKRHLMERFRQVNTSATLWANLPPAYFYHCIK